MPSLFLRSLFRIECAICGKPVEPDACELICAGCLAACEPPAHANRCRRCGAAIPRFIDRCSRCRTAHFLFDRAFCVHANRGCPAGLIGAYKLGPRAQLARIIGRIMADAWRIETTGDTGLSAALYDSGAPAVVAAPSSTTSTRSRGFASATLIARAVAGELGLRCWSPLRMTGRVAQKSLDSSARAAHAASSVRMRRHAAGTIAPCSTAIVVDDIFTTGATASACARVLKQAGVRAVYVLAFAMEV